MRHLLLLIIILLSLYESVLGLFQVLELKMMVQGSQIMLSGSFGNSGPYGGFIAISLAILGTYVLQNRNAQKWYDKALIILTSISCALSG